MRIFESMKSHFKLLLFLIIFPLLGVSKNAETPSAAHLYIENFKDDAIQEMLTYNIPASITLAQGMLESGNGTSDLALKANNHFGIKCHDEWDGETYIQNDDKKNECFRKYKTVLDSYTDHSLFIKSRARYAQLFELSPTDYRGWAQGLKEAGYATDPKYTQRLLDLIEAYELYKYDLTNHHSKRQKNNIDKKPAKHAKTEDFKPTTKVSTSATTKQSADKKLADNTTSQREILRFGIVKYIIVKPKDTFTKIAKDTDKDLWQLYKYNDMSAEEKLAIGQRIYLQPKRRKANEPYHVVKKGETMKSISQEYCIKLKKLYKKNKMTEGEEPLVGQKLYMQHQKK
jgi:LysM repeat protein